MTIPLLSSVQLTEGSEYKNIAKPNSAFNAELSSSNHVTSDTQLTGDHEANVHSTLLPSSNLEVNSDKQSKKRKSVNFNTVSWQYFPVLWILYEEKNKLLIKYKVRVYVFFLFLNNFKHKFVSFFSKGNLELEKQRIPNLNLLNLPFWKKKFYMLVLIKDY